METTYPDCTKGQKLKKDVVNPLPEIDEPTWEPVRVRLELSSEQINFLRAYRNRVYYYRFKLMSKRKESVEIRMQLNKIMWQIDRYLERNKNEDFFKIE